MNVLQLTLSFSRGGRRAAIATLLAEFGWLGVTCDLCCLDELGCRFSEIEGLDNQVDVLGRRSVLDRRAIGRLRSLCRRRRIDVIHAHDAASQFTGAMVRLALPRVRLLMTFHRSLAFESATWRDRLRNAFASAQCGAVVTGSRERRQHYLEQNIVWPDKVVRIPFGIDTTKFCPDRANRERMRRELGVGPRDVVLGAAGHFGPEKGIDVVLNAFGVLRNQQPTQRLLLVVLGDGDPQQQRVMRAAADRVPSGNVRFLGFRPDVERWFRAFDVFVHAPRQEAFGLVLAEAMATALPVVATRIGGIPDIVRDGSTGLLVSPDKPEALADAIEQLVSDPALAGRMGRTALSVARQEFAADVYARRYLRLYRDLLARRAPRGVDELEAVPTAYSIASGMREQESADVLRPRLAAACRPKGLLRTRCSRR